MFGRPAKSDPYLRVHLGNNIFDDRENAIDNVTEADLYKAIEFNTELPGTSQLIIEVMDHNDFGRDQLIGKTVIDLEDRWFDQAFRDWGKENRMLPNEKTNQLRWETKPIERRALRTPSSNVPRGVIECWLDILTPEQAQVFPVDDVALPPCMKVEVRVVIWKTKDVPPMDIEGMPSIPSKKPCIYHRQCCNDRQCISLSQAWVTCLSSAGLKVACHRRQTHIGDARMAKLPSTIACYLKWSWVTTARP